MRAGELVATDDAYFVADDGAAGEVLYPTSICVSGWPNRSLRGSVTCAALARETERRARVVADGYVPVRFTADLFRPAMMLPVTLSSTVIRLGRRIAVIGATMHQGGRPVAQATTLLAVRSEPPDGVIWSQGETVPDCPDLDHLGEVEAPLLVKQQGRWLPLADGRPSSARHTAWMRANDVVRGEGISPFQFAAAASDAANLVSHWGESGIGYVNADVTLNLSRLPLGFECGLVSESRFASKGISQSLSHLFDRKGVFGTVALVGLGSSEPGDPKTAGRW